MKTYLDIKQETDSDFKTVQLIDLINLTDFIDYSNLFALFEGDKTLTILDQLKKEKSIVSEIYNFQLNPSKHLKPGGFAEAPQNEFNLDFEN